MRWILIPTVWLLAAAANAEDMKLAPNRADEPLAKSFSAAKAAEFLDGVSLAWTRERKCGTCHTNYPFLMARPALREHPSKAETEIRKFFEERVANWDRGQPGDKPRWDTEVVVTATALAIHDAHSTGKLHPATRKALDRMWTLLKPNGAWNWLKCDWPPYEHDDYYGVLIAVIGVGLAPDGYAETEKARDGLAQLRRFLKANPAPDLHHRAMLLWGSQRIGGILSEKESADIVKELRAKQRADGGWCLPSLGDWKRRDGSPNDPDSPSDGYATGLVVYVLRQAGVPANDPAMVKGIAWLKSNQRESGRWFTRSVNNDKAHYMTHAGCGFAILALQACGQLPATNAAR